MKEQKAQSESASRVRRLNYFFTPRTVSFATLATGEFHHGFSRNPDQPVRAFLFCFTSLPKPGRRAMTSNAHAQLYVSQLNLDSVGEYDATTGDPINLSFITGLNFPQALAVASVPEPSAWSMITVGGVALLGIMLRKKHRIA
jgi:hypothetical protein